VLQVKLYPPKGRKIIDVRGVRAIRAVDDQGREVKTAGESEGDDDFSRRVYSSSSGSGEERAPQFPLNLQLPAAGAKTLEKVEGEAILTTSAGRKEHPVPEPKADPQKEIDLGDLVPGAKMIITSVKDMEKNNQGQIGLKITGLKGVERIAFDVKAAGGEQFYAYPSFSTRPGATAAEVTSTVTVRYSPRGGRSDDAAAAKPKITLVLHVPDDLKRERLKFTLETIDLY
jgi:hypothetical protein